MAQHQPVGPLPQRKASACQQQPVQCQSAAAATADVERVVTRKIVVDEANQRPCAGRGADFELLALAKDQVNPLFVVGLTVQDLDQGARRAVALPSLDRSAEAVMYLAADTGRNAIVMPTPRPNP